MFSILPAMLLLGFAQHFFSVKESCNMNVIGILHPQINVWVQNDGKECRLACYSHLNPHPKDVENLE